MLFMVFALLLLFSNCASPYRVPESSGLNYISNTSNDGLQLFYKYDVLEKKYAKKELRSGIKVVGLKIVNNSQSHYTFGENLILEYSNGKRVQLVPPETAFKKLKQGSAIYLLYLLATPLNLYTYSTDSNGNERETSSTPIGLILGPSLALGNVVASGTANAKFRAHLENDRLLGKTIAPGEVIHGFVPIKQESFDALHLKILPSE